MIKIIKYCLLYLITCFGLVFLQEQESIFEKENLAQSYIEAGLYDDAIVVYKNIFDLKKDILGHFNLDLINCLYMLSDLYILKEDLDMSQYYLKQALDIQYLHFLLYQKKYIPTLNKYQNIYSLKNDSNSVDHMDSLITILSNINYDSTYAAFDSSNVFHNIITLTSSFIDSTNVVSEYSLNDKAIELIDNAILYLNMGMFSEAATALDHSYKLNAPILDLNYYINLNFPDTTMLKNLSNTFIDIEQFDSTITTSNFFLGILDLKQKKPYELIINHLNHHISKYPNDIKPYLLIGDLYLKNNNYIDAMSYYYKAKLLQSENIHANLNLALCFLELDNKEDAIQQFEYVNVLAPNNAHAYYGLGLSNYKLNQFEKSIEAFTQALLLDMENANTYYLLGQSYKSLNKKKQAIEAFKMCIQLEPINGDAHFSLGEIYESIFQLDNALNEYKTAKKYIEHDMLNYQLGYLLYNQEEYQEALLPLRSYIINNPYDYISLEMLANIFIIENRHSEAIDAYSRLIDFNPDNQIYYNNIAESYLALENYFYAKKYFKKVLMFDEENTEVLIKLGNISNILNEFFEAEQYFLESIYCNYKSKGSLFQLGLAYGGQKKYLQALGVFKEALTYSLDDPILHYQLGVVYQELEIYDLSIQSYKQYLEKNKNDAVVYRMIGDCYFELKQFDHAITYFQKASKLFSNQDIKSIYGLGLSYKNINDNQNAAKFFKLGITINPDFAPLHFQLIDVYHLISKPREAKKECDILYMLDRPLYYSSRFCNN